MSKDRESLARLRILCRDLPEVSETDSWGHPNFRAGKRAFAAFEWIKGRPSIAIYLDRDEADAFLMHHREAFATPYGRGRWVSVWADSELDWGFLQDVVERGYRKVALKRMIAELETQRAG